MGNKNMATRKEYSTHDMQTGNMPPVDLDSGANTEDLLAVDIDLKQSELEELAFLEETMTIRLEYGSQESAVPAVSLSNNGQSVTIPVGVPVNIKRKFVGQLASAKTTNVQNNVVYIQDSVQNVVQRRSNQRFPFTVIRDPNPRGYDWLTKLMASA